MINFWSSETHLYYIGHGFHEKAIRPQIEETTPISLAMASIAPAPAQIPSTAAIAGCRQFLIALTKSPVILVIASNSFHTHFSQWSNNLADITPRAKVFSGTSDDDSFHLFRVYEVSKMVPHFSIGFKS